MRTHEAKNAVNDSVATIGGQRGRPEDIRDAQANAGDIASADLRRISPAGGQAPVRADGRERRSSAFALSPRTKERIVETAVLMLNLVGAVVIILPIVLCRWVWMAGEWLLRRGKTA
jgi:hypothetical protein